MRGRDGRLDPTTTIGRGDNTEGAEVRLFTICQIQTNVDKS